MKNEPEIGVRLVVALYRDFEQAARSGDITMAQYRTLLFLRRGSRRAGEIASASSVSKPTVSTMISRLRANGWIEEVQSLDDARITKLELTDSGRDRLVQFEAVLSGRLSDALPGLREDSWAALAALYRSHVQFYREPSTP